MSTPTDNPQADSGAAPPRLKIVSGDATPEEIAALVAVITSLSTGATPAPRRTSQWGAPRRQVRLTLPHGPGGWRASGLPR